MIKKTISKRRGGKKMKVREYLIISLFLLLGGLFVTGGQVVVKDGRLNVTEDFFVDSDVLYVDSVNNTVGIGTTSPNDTLEVNGSIITTGIQDTGKTTKMWLSGDAAAETLDYMEYSTDALAQAAYVSNDAQSLIDRTAGTPIGDMIAYGGLSAAFDGNINQIMQEGAGKDAVTVAYIGKDWGAGIAKIVSGFKAYGSNNWGFKFVSDPTVTITLQGSTDNFATSIVNLGSASATDANSLLISNLTGITVTTAYRYHRLKIEASPSEMMACAEAQFYSIENLQSYSESAIKNQGSYSVKGIAAITDSLSKTLTRAIGSPIDLTGQTQIKFDIYSSRTGSNIKVGIHDTGGTTTETTPNVISAGAWQEVTWDISGVSNSDKDAIDQINITIVNADADNTFYMDNMYAYGSGTVNDITFTTAGSERMRIDTSGNVGIGTSPSEKLDVSGNVRADDFIEYSDIYKGDALSVIKGMKTEGTNTGDWQGLDHSSLQNVEGLIQVYKDGNTIVYGRSINKMMDVNTRAIEQLLTKIEYLESEKELLKSELCKKDNIYTWC